MKSLIGLWLRSWIRRCLHWSAPLIIEEIEKYQLEGLRRRLGVGNKEFFAQWPITVSGKVQVGHCVSMAAYIHIWGDGGVTIGDGVMIGSHTAIVSMDHDINKDLMWKTERSASVTIEDNVWIGAHCVILPGVTIGRGAVIGAGAVVTCDVPPNRIVGGVPAKVLRMRLKDETDQSAEQG
ncbi:MAG: acyltransferase [Gammaproteobacteria bacterium]|nr:acyltransferase [Gammaproteobacteria bacterium]